MNNKSLRLIGLVVALILFVAAPGFAATDSSKDSDDENWKFNLVI